MRIVFDLEAVLKNRHSGFYTFGIGLLSGFARIENRPEMVLLCSKKLASQAHQIANSYRDWATVQPVNIKMRLLENLWSFSSIPKLETFTGKFDLYHSFHHLMPPTTSSPRLLTVHDLRRYMLPHLYPKSKLGRFENAVKNVTHFIAVSESTKIDLCRVFDIPEDKVSVTPLAYDGQSRHYNNDEKANIRQQLNERYQITLDRYLLAFSSPDQRKNITRIIKAFEITQSAIDNDIKLVVIGQPPKNETLPTGPNIIMPGAVEDVKPWLIGSEGLIFASLYEGFGLPILEAFASSVPVVTSDRSSMPEVAGNAAILVDPNSIDSISDGITAICRDPENTKQLIDRGIRRLSDFSWLKTAEKTLQVYQQLLESKK